MTTVWRNLLTLLLLAFCSVAGAADSTQRGPELREEFHQTVPLAPDGRISLANINGDVRIKVWDRQEVQIDAVKTARSPEKIKEAEIVVEAQPEAVKVRTKYPNYMRSPGDDWRHENPASVEFTLTVPRRSRLHQIELINGAFEVADYPGDVRASCINGRVSARGLTGEARLSTINGPLQVTLDQLAEGKDVNLNSVNSRIELTIPSDASAQIKANTVHGSITNDFNLPIKRGRYVGRDLAGELGKGGTRIRIGNVNGPVVIRRANDGRPLSPAVNLLPEVSVGDGNERENAEHDEDVAQAVRDAQREAQKAEREVAREMRSVQIEIAREMSRQNGRERLQVERELNRAARELERVRPQLDAIRDTMDQQQRAVQKETKSFPVAGNATPRLVVETFDGPVTVRAWDKPEISYTAVKRADDAEALNAIRFAAEQRGGEVFLSAKHPNEQHGAFNASVQFEVFVPRRCHLRITSGDGRLNVEGVNGELEIKTGDGAITVRDSGGRVQAITGDGRLSVDNFDGAAEVKTGDGRVSLEGRFTTLDAQTGDGTITLGLPADAGATIETVGESVSHDPLYVAEDNDESKRNRRWKIGNGGNLLKLRTGDGRIVLGRAGDAEEKRQDEQD
ncbi:MAG TPA: DUF4097 family beta strand repeat-containing protein [Pyrinomonadaceae bacterium]|nr:DUF4097 family beta strand repeat-containing protein [Pyrinomonadaceae bacterium]